MKDVQAIGEAFRPQKRTSSTSKHEISSLFQFFGHFYPPDPDPHSSVRIQIQLTTISADPDLCNTDKIAYP
jgi:hypothetical protein